MDTTFIPIIIGTDINAYYMATCFHQAYGIKPYIIGKTQMGFTHYSSIIEKVEINSRLDDPKQFMTIINQFVSGIDHQGKEMLLLGTNDHYVRLIVENSEELKKTFHFNYLNEQLLNTFQNKEAFYELAEKEGLDIPETYFYQVGEPIDFTPSRFPVILKPSNGIEYYRHSFAGQEKVYRLNSMEEVKSVIKTIEESGYTNSLIIQDYIPGDDTYIWDSVLYINTKSKAELVTFGQVALQEHEATAIGNYTAVVSRYNEEMMTKLKNFLEGVGYQGFANVDMKYDQRDGKLKVFEVNVRQGRSSYYATQMGHNLAQYLVEDVIEGKEKDLVYAYKEVLFTIVPKYILKKYVTNPEMNEEVRRLIKEKKVENPLFYSKDRSPLRLPYLMVRQARYNKKYKQATW